jgi:hypothetical protein
MIEAKNVQSVNCSILIRSLLVLLLAVAGTAPDAAAEMKPPAGKVILTLGGKIARTNVAGTAQFDRDMLIAVGLTRLSTSNQFETGVQDYEGVLLKDLLAYVGATGTRLLAAALDGYTIEIPVEDTEKYPVLLAMNLNGKAMTVRNKGPIWVIYPIDQFPELKDERFSARSIWQLSRIDVK